MTLIDIYGYRNNLKKVEKFCREALAIEDTVANIHAELADALESQKKYNEALTEFDKAISLRWDSWPSYRGKSSCLIFLGRYDESIRTCEYAINNIPRWLAHRFSGELYYNMAAAYARKGNKRKALTNIRKAIELGGKEVVGALRKDRDRDFCDLYTDPEFREIRQTKPGIIADEKKKSKE